MYNKYKWIIFVKYMIHMTILNDIFFRNIWYGPEKDLCFVLEVMISSLFLSCCLFWCLLGCLRLS